MDGGDEEIRVLKSIWFYIVSFFILIIFKFLGYGVGFVFSEGKNNDSWYLGSIDRISDYARVVSDFRCWCV